MRESHTAVIDKVMDLDPQTRQTVWRRLPANEVAVPFGWEYVSEPYEAAWASEAIFFMRLLAVPQSRQRVEARFQAEISPDGLHWCPLSCAWQAKGFDTEAQAWLHAVPVVRFGHWLRLRCQASTDFFAFILYLSLKE